MQTYASYPYRDVIKQLSPLSEQASLPATHEGSCAFRAFVVRLAEVFLQGDTEDKERLEVIVQEGLTSSIPPERHRIATPVHAVAAAGTATFIGSDHNPSVELPRYTTALKEYGDQKGANVRWVLKQLSLSPIQWQVVAMVENARFRAIAGNTREAKHRASQYACEALDIEM